MVYLIGNWELQTVKVGYSETADGAYRRLDKLQVGNCCQLELIAMIFGEMQDERHIHEMLARHRKRGEWFFLNDASAQILEHWFPVNLTKWRNDKSKHIGSNIEAHTANAIAFLGELYPEKSLDELARIIKDGNRRIYSRRKVR